MLKTDQMYQENTRTFTENKCSFFTLLSSFWFGKKEWTCYVKFLVEIFINVGSVT